MYNNQRTIRTKKVGGLQKLVLAASLALPMAFTTGCANVSTPAGNEGYVTQGAVFGKEQYIGAQVGPTSSGLMWLYSVENVDMRPNTYSEEYHILSRDNLNIEFKSHIKISLRAGSIKELVEKLGGQLWYKQNVKEQARSLVRETVQLHSAYEIKEKRSVIAHTVLDALNRDYQGTPFVFENVSIGNIDYPNEVEKAIIEKVAAEMNLLKKDLEIAMQAKDAEKLEVEAQGIARAQAIIGKTLDRNYLQYKGISAIENLIGSPNSTFVVVPMSNEGMGIPLILDTKGDTQVQSPPIAVEQGE